MENDIYITISGRSSSGKSTMLVVLAEFLTNQGFVVDPGTFDCSKATMLHKLSIVDDLKSITKIHFNETQLTRNPNI